MLGLLGRLMLLTMCSALVGSALAVSTTLQGPQLQVSNPLNSLLYTRGAPDLPLSDPRFVQSVTAAYPEQVHLGYASPDAMFVSWATGSPQISASVTPLDPTSVKTVVTYGSSPGNYSANITGYGLVYNQYYNIPAKNNTPAALNYTSGIQHHAKITGLRPNTTYYYRCGDPTIPAWSDEYNFTTSLAVGPNSFPMTMGVIADLGMTSNSTSTWEHLVANKPPTVTLIGDYNYANNYITNGTGAASFSGTFPGIGSQSYQPRWDGFQRWLQPYLQSHAFIGIEGNHEFEPNIDGVQFQAYLARYQAPGVESGSNTTLFYSYDMGPVHVVMLGAYVDYGKNSTQYQWLVNDLAKFNRSNTPWLVAMWHPPVYNSYVSHFKEVECFRQTYEPILYSYGTDFIMHGHVHAYERTNRVYNYTLNNCGPVYITLGDGGNIEQLANVFADSPGMCTRASADQCAYNYTSGPAAGQFCHSSQPEWSAFREQSFGHGIVEFINSTHALFTWHRNQDVFDAPGDQVYIVRTPDTCPNQQGPRSLAAAGGPSASIAALAPASATLVRSAPGPANLTGLYYGPSAPSPVMSSSTRP